MTAGFATPDGTARYAARYPDSEASGFFRTVAGGVRASSLGLGTYLGELDDATDRAYAEAVTAAIRAGVNFLDTAINYRNQRSERSIGAALAGLFASGELRRDEITVCTKAGFLTADAIDATTLQPDDVVARMHSMAPDFLADQIERSRANLGLDTIDVFYLHNPETQLAHVRDFEPRLRRAFDRLEQLAAAGRIRYYGTATWDGYRKAGQLSLERLAAIAREVAGDAHRFRYIQLPFNLAMPEGFVNETLETAVALGITAVASATLLQTRLLASLPDELSDKFPGCETNAQRAIQFTRSTPGVSVALVGMSRAAHVAENLAIARVPPMAREAYLQFYA